MSAPARERGREGGGREGGRGEGGGKPISDAGFLLGGPPLKNVHPSALKSSNSPSGD